MFYLVVNKVEQVEKMNGRVIICNYYIDISLIDVFEVIVFSKFIEYLQYG